MNNKWVPLIIFVIILGVARILGALTPADLPNLQPYGALFFCGMALFGLRSLWIPALAWFLTYPLTSALNGYDWSAQILVTLTGFAAIIALAYKFKNRKPLQLLLGSLTAAILFYLITNTLSWAIDPGYPKTLTGLTQSLWTGLPGFPPTWTFFRNSLFAQLIFTSAFLLAHHSLAPKKSHIPATA